MHHAPFSRVLAALVGCACVGWCLGIRSHAAEVTLKDGTTLKASKWVLESTVGGKSLKTDPDQPPNKCIIMLEEAGVVRIYVPKTQAVEFNKENDLRAGETFLLPPTRRSRKLAFESVGGKIEETDFSDVGVRRAAYALRTPKGNQRLDVIQQIIELHPKYMKVAATDYLWEFGLPTNSLSPEILQALLHRSIQDNNTADTRFAIVRFCLDGGFYPVAQAELESIRKDFPNRAKDVQEYSQRLKQYLADEAVRILEERRAAGQNQFAYVTAKQFLALDLPDVSGATIQALQKAVAKDDEILTRMEDARQLMGKLQGELTVEEAAEIASIRKSIGEELNLDTLNRLESFLNLSDAENRKPGEKLALAISGWLLGSDEAVTNLPQALRLWQARGLLLRYLRADVAPDRRAILEELEKLEGVGHQQVVRMLPLLPPRQETVEAKPSVPFTIEVPAPDGTDAATTYDILLPPEYHHGRSYPLVVALHTTGMKPQAELGWWARQAQRFGYIVVAPKYATEKQLHYDYSVPAHRAVLETIRDVRRRFTIDSDRIFLGGHGEGGDASFDIGLSHPDLFAGVVPIAATFEKFSQAYRENAKTLPMFILAGELHRDLLVRNATDITKMMADHYPVIYTVFMGRGFESFQSEDERIFEWMSHQVRIPLPTKIDVKTVRTTDNQFWWWTFSNFPPKFGITAWPESLKNNPYPVKLNAIATKAKGENVLTLNCPARWHSLWLFPEVVSFEKLLTIRQGDQQLYRAIPERNISASLEDFRLRGDRQRIAWGYLELGTATPRTALSENSPAALRSRRISSRNDR